MQRKQYKKRGKGSRVVRRKPKRCSIQCIIYAEPTAVRFTYPRDFPYAKDMVQNMFPKNLGPNGDSVVYFLNKREFDENSKILFFQAYVYKVNDTTNNWEMIVGDHEQTRHNVEFQPFEKYRRKRGKPFAQIVVKETWNNEVLFSLHINENFGLTILDKNYHDTGETFLSLFSSTNDNYGLVMNPDDAIRLLRRLKDLSKDVVSPITKQINPFYACMALVGSKGNKTRSLSICTHKKFVHLLFPIMKYAMELILRDESKFEGIVKSLYRSFNKQSTPHLSLTSIQKKVLRLTVVDNESIFWKGDFDFLGKKFNLVVNQILFRDEIGDDKLSCNKLLIKFKEGIMTIFNAIFMERRIIFYSKRNSIAEIARAIFSAVLLVSPPLTGILEYRVFPYCTINDLKFTKVDGYIAGVNDDEFKEREDLWDIFCNIDTGDIIRNKEVYKEGFDPAYDKLDNKFFRVLRDMFHYHVIRGIQGDYTDFCLRSHFYTYTQDLIRMAIGKTQDTGGVIKSTIEANFSRIENWKKTYSYSFYLKKLEIERRFSSIDESLNIEKSITLLRIGRNITDDVILKMLKNFAKLRKKNQIIEFLSYFPLAQGGLYPFAVLLYHKSKFVRFKIAAFLNRIGQTREGCCAISQLNIFLQLTYDRIIKQIRLKKKV